VSVKSGFTVPTFYLLHPCFQIIIIVIVEKKQNKTALFLKFVIFIKYFSYSYIFCFRCKAKGKISKNDKKKLVLTVGQENNLLSKFRNICNQRSKNEDFASYNLQ